MTAEITRLSPQWRSEPPLESVEEARERCLASSASSIRKGGLVLWVPILIAGYYWLQLFHQRTTQTIASFVWLELPLLFVEIWARYRSAVIRRALPLRATIESMELIHVFDSFVSEVLLYRHKLQVMGPEGPFTVTVRSLIDDCDQSDDYHRHNRPDQEITVFACRKHLSKVFIPHRRKAGASNGVRGLLVIGVCVFLYHLVFFLKGWPMIADQRP